ncbi:hypothetical protein QC764_401205 [Podospora pseudoanserina]|uniref:PPPDE domain-containing protein n=1 Tax=Podospora pseudoanserina TaxID=2609844 RepID=A0ABR0I804_9PEZI|nr:hypothetical protein QC764_401205 [Podospora pseudoanserina]
MSRRSSSSSTHSQAQAPRPSTSSGRPASSHGTASRGSSVAPSSSSRPPSRDSAARPPSRDSNASRPPSRDSNGARPPSRDSAPRAPSRPGSRGNSSVELDMRVRRQLHRVGWGSNTTGHQGLFLPDEDGSPQGRLYHISILPGGSSGTKAKTNYAVNEEIYVLTNTRARSAFPINGAIVNNQQVRRATEEVFNRSGDYHQLFNNCQHFCLESIIYMNQLWPEDVTAEAISHIRDDRPTPLTRMTTAMGRHRAAPPPAPAPGPSRRDSGRSNSRFSIN